MDCRSYRTLFSELHDERLRGESRTALMEHLEQCSACSAEWKAYHRLFSLVPKVDDLGPARPFQKPIDLPAAARPRAFGVRSRWERVRTAAAVVLLLGISHVAVFEWARRGGDDFGEPFEPLSSSRLELTPASLRREALAEQVDATDLLVRQIYQMPDRAGRVGLEFVNANVRLLEDGRQRLARLEPDLPRGAAGDFLLAWDRFEDRLSSNPAFDPARNAAPDMRRVRRLVEDSGLGRCLRPVRALVGPARARTTRDWLVRARTVPRAPEVDPLFESQIGLLAGDYGRTLAALERFRKDRPAHGLRTFTFYLEAEAYRRQGDLPRFARLVDSGPRRLVRVYRPPTGDPVAELVIVIQGSAAGEAASLRPNAGVLSRWCEPRGLTFELLPEWSGRGFAYGLLLQHEGDPLPHGEHASEYQGALRAAWPWLRELPLAAEAQVREAIRSSKRHTGLHIDIPILHRHFFGAHQRGLTPDPGTPGRDAR